MKNHYRECFLHQVFEFRTVTTCLVLHIEKPMKNIYVHKYNIKFINIALCNIYVFNLMNN